MIINDTGYWFFKKPLTEVEHMIDDSIFKNIIHFLIQHNELETRNFVSFPEQKIR
jgi:hypothetical protein